jgi:hypothetical protein
MTAADAHYRNAIQLRSRIVSGASNERPVQAWAAVCRACAMANDAFWREMGDRVHGRAAQAFLTNLDLYPLFGPTLRAVEEGASRRCTWENRSPRKSYSMRREAQIIVRRMKNRKTPERMASPMLIET